MANVIEEYRAQINILQQKIDAIQNACSHPAECVTVKHGADTGNWNRADDSYWIDYHCSLCDKRWTEEQ